MAADEKHNGISPLQDEGDFLLIDKPLDWTSFDVVAKIRNTYRRSGIKRKVGHCGTLDPKATGLLILASGRKTRSISDLEILDKVYAGTIKLGAMTDSHDTETGEYGHCSTEHLTEGQIINAASTFLGSRMQQPPMHSAVWHNGRRLYEHARKGEVIKERKTRQIAIHRFDITRIELPFVHFELHVSKGAYIRVIAHELGNLLGVGGYLLSLRRLSIGPYTLHSARSVTETIDGILCQASNSIG